MKRERVYSLRGLSKETNGRTILDVDALEVYEGELFVVVGPSGAGKSTLLRLLHFLESPTTGEIEYCGKPASAPVQITLRRQIGMVFQRPELLDTTVWDNVAYPLRLRGVQAEERIEQALEQLDLLPLAQAHAGTLSGGEAQRVALARVLVLRPRVLLLDEPTANLDPYNVELIEEIVRYLHQEATTVVLVTHNVFQARRLAERVALLLNGKLVEVSPAEKFFENPDDARALAFVRGRMIY